MPDDVPGVTKALPPMTLADMLDRLAVHVPRFVAAVRPVAPEDDAGPSP